jgi:hypothetical protein
MSEIPDLPEWVEDLVESNFDKGYRKGWEEGQKALWYRIRDLLEGQKPHGA